VDTSPSDPSEMPTVVTGPSGGAPSSALNPGTLLGNRYKITDILGVGGMGIVYRARDETLERDVALKVIRPELTENPEIMERFRREILLASKVTHKNILRIHDLGESDGLSYISMNYVEGETLSKLWRREGRLTPERTLPLAIQLCQALEAAHDAGVIHRDLKPQNILLDKDGSAYIADFGISRSADHGATMTQHGAVLGTVEYMSPEQARGETPDHRGDIYSLGMVLHRVLTGSFPFESASSVSSMLQRVQQEVPDIRKVAPDLPVWLVNIVSRALRRDPDERYQTAADMRRDLEQRQAGGVWRQKLRPKFLLRVAAAAALLAMVAFAVVKGRQMFVSRMASAPVAPQASLAVLPFENSTGDPSYDWINTGLPDLLRTDLLQLKALRLADADRVDGLLEGLGLGTGADLRADHVQRLAGLLGVENVLTGRLMKAGSQFRIEATLQQIIGGAVSGTKPIRVEGQGEDSLFAMVDSLTKKLRDDLDLSRRFGEKDRGVSELSTSSVDALRLYGEGLALARDGNQLEAASRLEAAVEQDAEFAVARAYLAEIYDRLGYSDKAAEQAAQAVQYLQDVSPYEAARIRAVKASIDYDLEAAEAAYTELTRISPNTAAAFFGLASVQEQGNDLEDALASLQRVLELDPNHADARFALGRVHAKSGDMTNALTEFNAALGSHNEVGNDEGRATVLNGLGNIYLFTARYDEALDHYQQSLDLREQIGDRRGVSAALNNISLIYDIQGRNDEAIETTKQALTIMNEIGDRDGMAGVYTTLGNLYQSSGRAEEALEAYREGLRIVRDLGDDASLAQSLGSIGYINIVMGNYLEAWPFLKDALDKLRGLDDKVATIRSLNDIGILEQIQGRYDKAIDYNMEGLALAVELGDSENEQIVLNANLANINEDRGEYGPALTRLAQAEAKAREIENSALIAACLIDGGTTRLRLGDLAGAEAAAGEALSIARELENKPLLAKSLVLQGQILDAKGERSAAASALKEAVGAAGDAQEHRLQLVARLHAAAVERSVSKLKTVVKEADTSGLAPLVSRARLLLARIHQSAGRAAEALNEAREAIKSATPLRQRDILFRAHQVAGSVLEKQGRNEEALEQYLAGLNALEELRQNVQGDALGQLVRRPDTVAFAESAGRLLQAMSRPDELERLQSATAP